MTLVLDDNWAYFIVDREIIPILESHSDERFVTSIHSLVLGIEKFGYSLFEEFLGSIQLYDDRYDYQKEIFIVSLGKKLTFFASDPLVTAKLIDKIGLIVADELRIQLTGFLSAKIVEIYSSLWNNPSLESKLLIIDAIFADSLDDSASDSSKCSCGSGKCVISGLRISELLILHTLIRQRIIGSELRKVVITPWALLFDKFGVPIHYSFQVPEEQVTSLAGMFSAILTFAEDIFGTIPKSFSFGSVDFQQIDFFGGRENLLALSRPLLLFSNEEFVNDYFAIEEIIRQEVDAELAIKLAQWKADRTFYSLSIKPFDQLVNSLVGELKAYEKTQEKQSKKILKKFHPIENFIREEEKSLEQVSDNVIKRRYKLILAGDGSVGKTTMAQRFLKKPFSLEYQMTMGVEYNITNVDLTQISAPVQLQILDMAGQPLLKVVREPFYSEADVAIIVCDLSRPKTFNNVIDWVEEILTSVKTDIPVIIVGNKLDLYTNGRVNDSSEIIEKNLTKVELTNPQIFESTKSYLTASAKTGENVEAVFKIALMKAISWNAKKEMK